MFKRMLLVSNFVFFAHAMELQQLHIKGSHDKSDEASLCSAQTELTRSYEARELGWVPAMYQASGFSDRMSREFFCVNALAKIKEAITEQASRKLLQIGADLGGSSVVEDRSDRSVNWLAANISTSVAALMGTFIYKVNYEYPQIVFKKPLEVSTNLVMTSCLRLLGQLNQSWGMEWAHECIMKSNQYDAPCNVTAARIEFERNGKYFYDASACCFDHIDPACNKAMVDYMNTTYPLLYAAAQNEYEHANHLQELAIKARGVPFYTVLSTVVTLNMLFQLAGYKYRAIMKARAEHPVPSAQELNPEEL
jgi:hypothetical protein